MSAAVSVFSLPVHFKAGVVAWKENHSEADEELFPIPQKRRCLLVICFKDLCCGVRRLCAISQRAEN